MPILEEIDALLVEYQEHQACLASYEANASPLYVFEARYTLFHVHRLLQNRNNPALEQALERLLGKRWDRLTDTDLQYFYDIQSPANHMCIAIAKALGKQQNKSHLLFLIPNLSRVPASDYIASSYEDDLDFKRLILSDDGMRLLCIPEVLEFAEQDGVLKHSALRDGVDVYLSAAEESRLLARHPSVENYYHAIRDKLNFQLHGETAGAYIARLIKGLSEGGAGGSGSEYLTGSEANIAITEFSFFLESLTQAKREKILEANLFERWVQGELEALSIGQAWRLLENPSQHEEQGEQSITYCVEMIADRLGEILQANDFLYQVMPFEQEEGNTLESFKTVVSECKAQMMVDLNSAEAHRYYGTVGDDKVLSKLLKKISRDTAFKLESADLLFVARLFSEHNSTHASTFVLRDSCRTILKRNRTNLATEPMQQALKACSDGVLHDVNQLLLQPLLRSNRHGFYANVESCCPSESLKRARNEDKEDDEGSPPKKKKHVCFDVETGAEIRQGTRI
ncbi:MAG: hypothetical protein P1U36_05895 [Legionellaceae bacterium]|nr:hypothetical protein [Legionellaceae bacterium]